LLDELESFENFVAIGRTTPNPFFSRVPVKLNSSAVVVEPFLQKFHPDQSAEENHKRHNFHACRLQNQKYLGCSLSVQNSHVNREQKN